MKQRTFGIECEFPAIQIENGLAATRDQVKAIWKEWAEAPHVELYIDYATKQPVGVNYTLPDGRSFIINSDAGVALIEFSLPPFSSLKEMYAQLERLVAEYIQIAHRHGIALMSYGLQPKTPWFYPDLKSEKQWYRTFGRLPFFQMWHGLFHTMAAHQPCIGITYDELIPVTNTLNALGGVTIALFANSSVGESCIQDHHEEREARWEKSATGFGEDVERIQGIPKQPFTNFESYLKYSWSVPLPCVFRGNSMHITEPLSSIEEYLRTETSNTFDVALTKYDQVTPDISDVNMLNMYIWIQSRPRLTYSKNVELRTLLEAVDNHDVDTLTRDNIANLYVENRNIAGQPWNEILTAPAYILGLIENIEKAKTLVESKQWQYWIDLRKKTFKSSMEVEEVIPLAQQVVEIAREGLQMRGLGEEEYLAPLFERIQKKESLAMRAIKEFAEQGIETFIENRLITL